MKKTFLLLNLFLTAFASLAADYVVVTASNDMNDNKLVVFDASGNLLQSLSTNGKGGVPANKTGGGVVNQGHLVAVINYGSQNVSLFKQNGNTFTLSQVIPSDSQPVSVAFGHDHLYILGTTTIESHALDGDKVALDADGSSKLLKADGSSAQVGVLTNQLIVSEKNNTIELISLQNGVVTSTITPVELPPPPKNDTPVGLATEGNTAYVTIAHSDEVGLVRDGKLQKVSSSQGQHAPCWLAVMGSSLFCSNTPSKTISIYKVSASDIALEQVVAATIQTGGLPSDIDAQNGIVAVLDTGEGPAHISQFQVDNSGKLQLLNTAMTEHTANGVAIVQL